MEPLNASSVKLLPSETEAFQKRIELIEGAQSAIDMSSYEISKDNTSRHILSALLCATKWGVTVRVMVDVHIGSNRLPKPLTLKHLVAKLVKSLGRLGDPAESLDDFRYTAPPAIHGSRPQLTIS